MCYKSQMAAISSSRAGLLRDAWFIFDKAWTSCTEQIMPTGSQRYRNGIEHPANFQSKIPCADSWLYKNEKWPEHQSQTGKRLHFWNVPAMNLVLLHGMMPSFWQFNINSFRNTLVIDQIIYCNKWYTVRLGAEGSTPEAHRIWQAAW